MRLLGAFFAFMLALGGVVAGMGAYEGTREPPGESTPWFIATGLCFVVALILIIIGFIITTRPEGEAEPREQAKNLSREIYDYLGDRKRGDPSYTLHWRGLPAKASEARRRRAFDEHTESILA
jgi:hypothetical protein